jgi:Zn-dependent alcohol dehydrogenase
LALKPANFSPHLPVAERLALAKELGATHTINGAECKTVEQIVAITGKGVNYSVLRGATRAL